MKFDAEKWSLFERAHEYRFLLRLLGFALVADLLLVFGLGTNLGAISWEEVGSRPGILLGAVLAYGAVMTVGSTVISWAATDVFSLFVPTLQRWLGSSSCPRPDSRRYVRSRTLRCDACYPAPPVPSPVNSLRYFSATCGRRSSAGTSTSWAPSEYGPTW